MMKFLNYIKDMINKANEMTGKAVSWLTTILVLVVCSDVFSRYLLGKSLVSIQELQWHIFAIIFLLGAGNSLRNDRHVRVDIIYARLSAPNKAWINIIGTLIFLIPFCLILIWSSHDFIINSFNMGEKSPNPGGLPARYILKSAIPIGFFLILVQGISMIIESIGTIITPNSQELKE